MKDDQIQELVSLRTQVDDLGKNITNPKRLEETLLETCNGLVSILEDIQKSPVSGHLEVSQIDRQIQSNIKNILNALERSQHEMRESEARYRAIVESQTELICRFTPDGALSFFNEAFRNYLADFGDITLGQNLLERLGEKERAIADQYIAALSPDDPVVRVDYSIVMPDGDVCWQQWTGLGNFDTTGRLIEIQVVGHDITDRKMAEIAARQHNRELSALHNATAALLTTLDPEALLGRILDAAISAIPAAKKGMIHLIAQDTGQLEMRASVGYSDPRIIRIRVPSSVSYVAKSVRERNPLLIQNLQADPAYRNSSVIEAREVLSAIVAPLILKNQVLGAVSLESNQVDAFNDNDLRLLVSFAATATAAIHNANLHSEVQKLAITDALTNLYNRRGFYELGQREVERSRRYKRPLVAIMMDIDHFKFINDFYGHAAGDQVLQAVAKRCSENLRRIDILGRFGGDEFTILLPETDMFTASGVAERVRQYVANRPVMTDTSPVTITVSLGVARATATTPDLDVLISRADAAMYLAKKAGRNRVEFG